ncbi:MULTISPECIES: phytochelatin synthase family protein [unclassified Roseofilum]|uniref:phytochelatin synthase family protein n=1 Tax=unclassified Roseofilum TaxID=2620099 RepID=UPI000E91DA8C|nr:MULTISPECIES: phytochelatin synthase family protein [unclassified Roseofilum]HBQ99884.1 glutathione gamma-glutamylcysteinyltransferase [Cyanobacteria bacterium UBA11691]MBP0007033.1 phytochelatin synthase family protein [Roseofilum sp. Belize Diploria]MBP0013325.1 phytochelatin synthase family protein [Roseofilum sp. SID3]MBP0023986.1 phytochelatin synthase family protein [Roseofilum sp. SID2]MBP0031541.1 phytochelatin synthase family protein [Roseofilum sp. Belize BBD 4]
MDRFVNSRKPLVLLVLGLLLLGGRTVAQTLPIAERLIEFDSSPGEELLIESRARQDYVPLSIQFETQKNQAFCGVASMVMVLNALGIEAPDAPEYGRKMFTQDNIFNAQTDRVIARETIAKQGMTLEELGAFLARYPLKTQVYHGGDLSLQEFRQLMVENLQQPDNFVLVNYLRKSIEQERGGHISPVAAYHQQSDRFLILDVARYKYPPVWVTAEDLWNSTRTVDSVSGKTRGLVLLNAINN